MCRVNSQACLEPSMIGFDHPSAYETNEDSSQKGNTNKQTNPETLQKDNQIKYARVRVWAWIRLLWIKCFQKPSII